MRVLLALAGLHALPGTATTLDARRDNCRCLPGDDCWPSDNTWNDLNSTVSGRLVKTIPIGSPCHDPNYEEEACSALKARWTDTSLQ